MPDQADPIVVVNIAAVSYSGSTWANLLLGSNSEAFSVGEMDRIQRTGNALCSLHGPGCPVWSRLDPQSSQNVFQQIAGLSGRRFLIVNNTKVYRDAQRVSGVQSKFLWIIRDGRAVAASAIRRYPDNTMWRAARNWAKSIRRIKRFLKRQPAGDVMSVHYEQFQTNREEYLPKICAFLGMRYEPAMLQYWNAPHHFIGGNTGGLSAVMKAQGIERLFYETELLRGQKRRIDWKHYGNTDPANFVDERWKRELTPRQLRIFRLAAGRLNRRFGYSSSPVDS